MAQKTVKSNCKNCKEEFNKYLNVKNHKFCSYKCKEDYYKNHPKQENVICSNCGKKYTRRKQSRYNNNYCCLKCELEFKHKQKWEFRNCIVCKKEFECLKTRKVRMCSIQCQGKWQSQNLIDERANNYKKEFSKEDRTIQCIWCGLDFKVMPYDINKVKFCSKICRQEWFAKVYSQTDEWKLKSQTRAIKILEDGLISGTNTKIQILVNSILDDLKIKYKNEKGFNYYVVDNFLYECNLIIEVMGTFWHVDSRFYSSLDYLTQVNRVRMDKIKHINIKNKYNIEILYLWEFDILNDLKLCIELIKEYINNKGVLNNYHSFNYKYINKLFLNEDIIHPYMDWNIEDLRNIININVKEKMSKKQLDKWIIFDCEYCGCKKEELISHYKIQNHHYCCRDCSNKAKNKKIKVECDYCRKEIMVIPSKYNKNNWIFCNQECQHKFQKEFGFKRNGGYIEFNCNQCNKLSKQKTGDYNGSKHHFCSRECNYIFKRKLK